MQFESNGLCFACLYIKLNYKMVFSTFDLGFDAASGDPLGECNLSPTAYAYMTHMLQTVANGRVVLLLEVCT